MSSLSGASAMETPTAAQKKAPTSNTWGLNTQESRCFQCSEPMSELYHMHMRFRMPMPKRCGKVQTDPLPEISRKGWYDVGSQRRLLAEIMEHYGMELIENQFAARRKPAAGGIQPP